MNTARGYLVEFLVARAVDDPSPIRVEWGPYDVEGADATLIEVKTTGRLQSWAMKEPSTPSWSFKSVKAESVWSETEGAFVPVDPKRRVHVWVFALHTATQQDRYDPLDVDQWEFRVVSHRELLATGQVSARLSFFERLGVSAVSYEGLRHAVELARKRNEEFVLS
jgi:hypothetical protein